MTSSRIEGEQLEVDSYVKHKMLNVEYLPELTEKPNDLSVSTGNDLMELLLSQKFHGVSYWLFCGFLWES